MAHAKRFSNPTLFICDVQEKFRPAIHGFSQVMSTTQKMIRACKILSVPIYATTQNASRLGPICSELDPSSYLTIDKTAFSIMVPELRNALAANNSLKKQWDIATVGIETYICVTQTALDLLKDGHKVYIITDGVSSCNEGERGVALSRLRAESAVVTTSESWMYEYMGDAAIDEFKSIAGLVKESKEETASAVRTLCKM